jgi:hypothetical protein
MSQIFLTFISSLIEFNRSSFVDNVGNLKSCPSDVGNIRVIHRASLSTKDNFKSQDKTSKEHQIFALNPKIQLTENKRLNHCYPNFISVLKWRRATNFSVDFLTLCIIGY